MVFPPTQVFISSDQRQIRAGDNWLQKIVEGLREAKVVILLLSEMSIARPWVNFEAGAAWLSDKHVIPVCFKGLSKGNLPKPYSDLQSLNLNDEIDRYRLLSSVCGHLGRHPKTIGPPPNVIAKLAGITANYDPKVAPYLRFAEIVKAFEKADQYPFDHQS